jgi:hypothetical protein
MKEKNTVEDVKRTGEEACSLINSDYEYFFERVEKEVEKKYVPYAFLEAYNYIISSVLLNTVFDCIDFGEGRYQAYKNGKTYWCKNYTYKEAQNDFIRRKKKLDSVIYKHSKKYMLLPDNVTPEDFLKFKNDMKKLFAEMFNHKESTLTDLQQHLIKKSFVLSDGRRANKSLNDIACEVREYNGNKPVTWQYLQENFIKRNGDKFSQSYCENARDYANILSHKKAIKKP